MLGLSDKTKEAELFYDILHPGLTSLGQMKDDKPNPSCKIKLDTLDNYCKDNKIVHIHALKIDVEGFELDVLKGARNMLKNKAIDFIQFELSDTFLARFGLAPKIVSDLLGSLEYKIYDFDENLDVFSGPLKILPPGNNNFYSSHKDLAKL